ncbi:hypothetical protein BC834DRAFT_906443 [Gloeopeniophorella convolvens]|nr:hypothetical protein BC834DRAFT_906443 [Gloeopeniophorella convolvens]
MVFGRNRAAVMIGSRLAPPCAQLHVVFKFFLEVSAGATEPLALKPDRPPPSMSTPSDTCRDQLARPKPDSTAPGYGGVSHTVHTLGPTPISHLPVELLRAIFVHLRAEFLSGDTKHTDIAISLVHVCRHWRHVVMDLPQFWRLIPLWKGKNWANLALERAKPLTIQLVVDSQLAGKVWYQKLCIRALHEMDRVQTLLFGSGTAFFSTTTHSFIQDAMDVLGNSTAPALERFEAASLIDRMPDTIFQGCPPANLRSITLYDCAPGPESPLLHPNLACLDLRKCSGIVSLGLLWSLPNLTTLCLTLSSSGIAEAAENPKIRPIALPNLKRIVLVDKCSIIAKTLQLLRIPTNATLDLTLLDRVTDNVTTFVEEIRPLIESHISLASSAGISFQTLTIDASSNERGIGSYGFSLRPAEELDDDALPSSPPPQQSVRLPEEVRLMFAQVDHQASVDQAQRLALSLGALPALNEVRELQVRGNTMRFLEDWHRVHTLLPKVNHIHAWGLSAHGLVATVNDRSTDDPAFPHLRDVWMEDVTFLDTIESTGMVFYNELREGLKNRIALQLPARLHITRCKALPRLIQLLRAHVGEDMVM